MSSFNKWWKRPKKEHVGMWYIGVGPSQAKGKPAELPAEGPKAVMG